ncbi:MAG: ABC transporter substrate-binding protein [Pseudomonadota bacterium]
MRKLIIALALSISAGSAYANNVKKVYISQIVEHAALDATTKGIIDELEAQGFKRGKNLDLRVESAQGSNLLAAQIASKFVSTNPDVVVGVGTSSAQSLLKYAIDNKVKLVFSSVTDPVSASITGNNTSGVSNFVALEPQLELFKKLQPKLKRFGILYNPGELNSVSIIQKLEILCPKFDLILVKQAASKTADIVQSATKLASEVDAILISNDNTALSAIQSVVLAANKAKIPVYVSDVDAVELGCVAALGPNQYQVGLQTGAMIARVLNGEDVNQMSVEFPSKTELYLNFDAAKINGIVIPDDLKAGVTRVIEKTRS